jgi:hypothetical protein
MNRKWKLAKKLFSYSASVIAVAFTIIPESIFAWDIIDLNYPKECIVLINRIALFLIVLLLVWALYSLYRLKRRGITIEGNGYGIRVEYGDIFEMDNCKKVISFDECFITSVGEAPADIKPDSVCGKFLTKIGIDKEEVNRKIQSYKSSHAPTGRSAYENKPSYQSGSIIPFKDSYFLLAFGKLDNRGLCRMTREDYLACLATLWEELDAHYAQHDVAIPVLGSGVTRFKDEMLTQQQLVDILIASYKLSPYKMQHNVLHIVCQKRDDFSLNRVGEYI